MGVKFEKNNYLTLVKSRPELDSNDKIIEFAKHNHDFSIGNVTFEQFGAIFKGKGWFGRKVVALPMAAWSGIVKAIAHSAKAVLIGNI